jgi:myo-inositol-1(or 4)-monophosphatase
MNSVHPMWGAAVAAARAAAELIRAAAADPSALQVRQKSPNDFVTQVDTASEQVIVRTLLEAFPAHAVRSEESARPHGDPNADHLWIVDPLDGTTNFIHGYPAFGVSIALAVRGRITLGVVLDVSRDHLYHASLGGGAWRDAQRLQVSVRHPLHEALVATSCPYRAGAGLKSGLQMLGAVMQQVSAIRRSGSAALDLAALAAGHVDGFFDLGLNAWDVAAGSLLVSEAGGVVSSFRGEPDFLEARECVAANPALHAELVALLRSFAWPRAPSSGH